MAVGFGWGGWVTGGTSQALAATAGDNARGELASAICVEKFKAAPDAAAKLAEFKVIPDSYKHRQFIEAAGWATMPGQTSPDRLGVQGCATALATERGRHFLEHDRASVLTGALIAIHKAGAR